MSNKIKNLWKTFRGKGLAWEKSDDIKGYKPKFVVKCRMCRGKWFKRPAMLLRNSNLMVSKQTFRQKKVRHCVCRMNYKCPRCDWVIPFLITGTKEYTQKIFTLRGMQSLYYPGIEEWSENEYAKQKLKALGYM